MARSRSPDGRERSQASSRAVTSAALIVAGSRVSRQPATGGIAVPRSVAVMPLQVQKPQQRPQVGRLPLGRPGRPQPGAAADQVGDDLGTAQILRPGLPAGPRYAAGQEPPRHPLIAQHGQRRHAPLQGQVAAVAGKQFLRRRRRRLLRRQDLLIPADRRTTGPASASPAPAAAPQPAGPRRTARPGPLPSRQRKDLRQPASGPAGPPPPCGPARSAARNRTAPVHADSQPHTRPAGPHPRPTKPCPSCLPSRSTVLRQGKTHRYRHQDRRDYPDLAGPCRPRAHPPPRHPRHGRTSSRDNPEIGINPLTPTSE